MVTSPIKESLFVIDLHTHSTASDGTYSPSELIVHAKEVGLNAVALTDHDTFNGLEEALDAAKRAEIRCLPGIELEVSFVGGLFHLLGLNVTQWHTEKAREFTEMLSQLRIDRNLALIERLQKEGFDITLEEFEEQGIQKNLSMLHFALWFVQKGHAKNIKEVFATILAPGSACHVPKKRFELETLVETIVDLGGRPVLAHPLTLRRSFTKLPDELRAFKERGLQGIECWYSQYSGSDCRRLEKIAGEVGLFVTGGSDFHGGNRPSAKLGYAAKREIEDEYLQIFND